MTQQQASGYSVAIPLSNANAYCTQHEQSVRKWTAGMPQWQAIYVSGFKSGGWVVTESVRHHLLRQKHGIVSHGPVMLGVRVAGAQEETVLLTISVVGL
jgi:hypothetical protein